MTLIGFHFTKIMAEKQKTASGKISVKNNIVISKVQEAKLNIGSAKEAGIEFSFVFSCVFGPEIGEIVLEGAVVYMNEETKVKQVLAKWNKEKKLAPEMMEELYNHVLSKCNVEALILGRDMQLPAHIPLPKVTSGEKKK
ncbi:MAG: hypothetical protein ABIJ34_05680 [archaeon]